MPEQEDAERRQAATTRLIREFWRDVPIAGALVEAQDKAAAETADAAEAAWRERIETLLADLRAALPTASEPTEPTSVARFLPRRNTWFSGRVAELDDVFRRLAARRCLAVTGLGGRGKTQLANEYAHRHADLYPAGILWASADSASALLRDIGDMARQLGLRVPDDAKPEDLSYAWKAWLAGNTGWLLVLDQADDVAALREVWEHVVPPDLSKMPGHVLVTGRDADIVHLGFAEPLELDDLTEDEATDFLLRRTKRPESERGAARALAAELGRLALALEQAAAYIVDQKIGLAAYLDAFRIRRLELLKTRPKTGDYRETVLTTWYLSIETVREENAASADVLTFSSFLAPDWIPHFLLVEGAPHLGEPIATALAGAAENPLAVPELLAPLGRLSLIERGDEAFRVHRLVQEVVRAESDRTLWEERAVLALNVAFPCDADAVDHWPRCQQLLAHVHHLAGADDEQAWQRHEAGQLLNQTGLYLRCRGRFAEAEPLLRSALGVCERVLGPEHPDTVVCLNNLATLLVALGRNDEAEQRYRRALTVRQRLLGPDHPATATSLNNLAGLLEGLGRYEEAEPLYRRAIKVYERELGPGHPTTAASFSNLAVLLAEQGRHEEAEALNRRAMKLRARALGPGHPDLANSLNNLAGLLHDQGRYRKAERLFRRALKIREQTLGADHPDTATSLGNQAQVLCSLGRYQEAGRLYGHALEIRERVLGPDHPDTAGSLYNLGMFLAERGNPTEGEPLVARALAIAERVLGQDHPHTKLFRDNLAHVRAQLGHEPDA